MLHTLSTLFKNLKVVQNTPPCILLSATPKHSEYLFGIDIRGFI